MAFYVTTTLYHQNCFCITSVVQPRDLASPQLYFHTSPYLVGQDGRFRMWPLLNTLVYELLLLLFTFQHFLTEGLDFPQTFRILQILVSADSHYRYPHSAGPIRVCSTSSTSQRQCLHRSHGSVPVLARYFPKPAMAQQYLHEMKTKFSMPLFHLCSYRGN